MDIKVDPKELIKIYTEVHNLFFGMCPTMWDKLVNGLSSEDIIAKKQYLIKAAIVEMLNKGLERDTLLPKEISPFKIDYDILCKGLNLTAGEEDGKRKRK